MISAILLAAGESKRMIDENKLSKKFKNIPLINHSVKNILSSNIDELIIVLGYDKENIEKLIEKNNKIKIFFNKNFKTGMASSIKIGLNQLSNETEAFFICLGDMPMINKKIYNHLISYKNNKDIVVPTYNNNQGNPILFSKLMKSKIMSHFLKKKNGIIEGTNIFVESYIRPIKVIVVGAVHIAQYLINFATSLNFEISIIDPRGYFASEQRFPGIKVINKWPEEAFAEIKTDQNTALIALTHDPKIDDPALQHALKKEFFYIGALGSKKTHANRCTRLKESGFTDEQINKIFGPIGIKLGGKSAPEIALSIVAQLVSEVYKK